MKVGKSDNQNKNLAGQHSWFWKRRGQIIKSNDQVGWWKSHAQSVTPLVLAPDRWRLYFSARNQRGQSFAVYVDVDPLADMRVLDRHFEPLLSLGVPGAFDSAGYGPSMAIHRKSGIDLYYSGIHIKHEVPHGLAIGLATSQDGKNFERKVAGPVLATGPNEPYFVATPYVEEGPDGFTMWYMSCLGWKQFSDGTFDPKYDIKRALSADGENWTTSPEGGLKLAKSSSGLVRPWLAKIDGEEFLFFSQRGELGYRKPGGENYRILSVKIDANGSPESKCAQLKFENPPQPDDWDSWMQAYASIVPFEDGFVMFYNGNDFGRDGFGWATLGL